MKSAFSPRSVRSIEALEARIAPAGVTIFAGSPNGGDTGYNVDATHPDATPFVKTSVGDPISAAIGVGPNTYYLKLSTGDRLALLTQGYTGFITGTGASSDNIGAPVKGTVIAVFVDDGDGIVEPNELTGLSLGKDVNVQVSGTVAGSVASNYNDALGWIGGGVAGGAPDTTDLLHNSIASFTAIAVKGTIFSGGDIKSVKVTNDVTNILAGRAANGQTYDFDGAGAGGTAFTVANVPGAKGVNISNVNAGDLTLLQAGDGGAGGIGGSVANVTLVGDSNGFSILAGNGGAGIATKTSGGAGGKITNVVINGFNEGTTDPTNNSTVLISAGAGGDAFAGSVGKGGLGGDLSKVYVGYELKSGIYTASVNALQDVVGVNAGAGGAGKTGGNGGKLSAVSVIANPHGTGNDINIQSGAGGDNLVANGKAGSGGLLSTVDARNPGTDATSRMSFINLKAGDGGAALATSTGGNGGSLLGATMVGFSLDLAGGNGTDGTNGGFGGDVKNVLISDGFQGVQATAIRIDAGSGGDGITGKGNKGGAIDKITVTGADLATFDLNQTAGSANGGNSVKGIGGVGGGVSNLTIDENATLSNSVTMNIRSGDGGLGGSAGAGAGGAGGSITGNNSIVSVNASLNVHGGNGGNAQLKSAGGAGGSVTNFAFFGADTLPGGTDPSAGVVGGNGGTGVGTGSGGVGGSVKSVNLETTGVVTVSSGRGGDGGATGAAGAGGSVLTLGALSGLGSVSVTAERAGVAGIKAGAGGSINGGNLQAATAITATAGAGFGGGVGGSVLNVGFSDPTGTTGPNLSVAITAGAGSGAGTKAGVGGSVTGVTGYIGLTQASSIRAGLGGAVATAAAAGGSVSNVSIFGGGGAGANFVIEAGDAANVASAKKGGVGGSVKTVAIDDLNAGTVLLHIAAGAGGNTALTGGTGGLGGTVDQVQVDYTIGVRSGAGFGYNTMGGIFAGAGGTGTVNGLAGNVTNISADAIAAIVAGKPVSGDAITERNLVQTVSNISLNDNIPTKVNGNGAYTNFDTANFIGAVVAPTAAGTPYPAAHSHANTFDSGEYGDNDTSGEFSLGDSTNAQTDGFVAAYFFKAATVTARPEALLTLDAVSNTIKFIDLNNLNGQTVG